VWLPADVSLGRGELWLLALNELVDTVDWRPGDLLALGRLRGGDLIVQLLYALEGAVAELPVDVRPA
jgi:hypothetical protein